MAETARRSVKRARPSATEVDVEELPGVDIFAELQPCARTLTPNARRTGIHNVLSASSPIGARGGKWFAGRGGTGGSL